MKCVCLIHPWNFGSCLAKDIKSLLFVWTHIDRFVQSPECNSWSSQRLCLQFEWEWIQMKSCPAVLSCTGNVHMWNCHMKKTELNWDSLESLTPGMQSFAHIFLALPRLHAIVSSLSTISRLLLSRSAINLKSWNYCTIDVFSVHSLLLSVLDLEGGGLGIPKVWRYLFPR